MANPKRRQSHSRGAKRRTHYTVKTVNTVECPNCSQPKLPHKVCPNCGYYNGKQVINTK
ncbi:MAG: 50S ribosomal protein L32 [Candidatus Marinimicrobia bacterium]|nr:50S ribosomal protein L32 [Candidatus Neomarinimicrobiota bacterium]